MSIPFVGELKIVSFGFAPKNWALANGQLMPINQNQALFSLLGTSFGGNGQTTFALPDMRGRTPMHFGSGPAGNVSIGQSGGEETHILSAAELPMHAHGLTAQNTAATANTGPSGNSFANSAIKPYRNNAAQFAVMAPPSSSAGSSQAHSNLQPFMTLNFIIALSGIFPSRN